jgi:hypothetical protein
MALAGLLQRQTKPLGRRLLRYLLSIRTPRKFLLRAELWNGILALGLL